MVYNGEGQLTLALTVSLHHASLCASQLPFKGDTTATLQLCQLNPHLSVNAPQPWGEYKIKQSIHKLERVRGLTPQQKQEVAEFVKHYSQAVDVRREGQSQQEQGRIFQEAERRANESIARLEATRKADDKAQAAFDAELKEAAGKST